VIYQADSWGTYTNCTFKFLPGTTAMPFALCAQRLGDGRQLHLPGHANEQCSAFMGDYTATLNATGCHFNNLAGLVFRSGGSGYNVNLVGCDSTGITARVMFFIYNGNITITRSNLTIANKLVESQGWSGAVITVSVKRSTIAGTEIMINADAATTMTALFENCIIKGFWVALYANSTSATTLDGQLLPVPEHLRRDHL